MSIVKAKKKISISLKRNVVPKVKKDQDIIRDTPIETIDALIKLLKYHKKMCCTDNPPGVNINKQLVPIIAWLRDEIAAWENIQKYGERDYNNITIRMNSSLAAMKKYENNRIPDGETSRYYFVDLCQRIQEFYNQVIRDSTITAVYYNSNTKQVTPGIDYILQNAFFAKKRKYIEDDQHTVDFGKRCKI